MTQPISELESIVLGGGCFWCLEACYQQIQGVQSVISGYAGGAAKNPDYQEVEMGSSGHAQVVKIAFDAKAISLSDILDIFWVIHDPTTLNRQAYDIGTQYRSIILYNGENQRRIAEKSKDKIQPLWRGAIVTQILPLRAFYEAEEYLQNYYQNHPTQGYCQVIINPKLAKLREKFANRLKRKDRP